MEKLAQKLTLLIQIQIEKVKKKGFFNYLLGWTILICFFYLFPRLTNQYWPIHISHPCLFYVVGSVLLANILTPLYSLIYLPAYLGWTSAYEKYRITPTLLHPWEKPDWADVRARWIKTYLFNKLIVNPLYLIVMISLFGFKIRCDYESFPSTMELVKQIGVAMLVDDILYMLIHRLFHEIPTLYRFHKIHHEYESTFSMVGQYCHPIEHIFANILPVTITFSLMNTHMFSLFFWVIFKLYNSAEGHSGYEFPWSPTRVLPFVYGAAYHEFHHTHNVGNYATSFYIFETLLGTNQYFWRHEAKQNALRIGKACD